MAFPEDEAFSTPAQNWKLRRKPKKNLDLWRLACAIVQVEAEAAKEENRLWEQARQDMREAYALEKVSYMYLDEDTPIGK
jgi:hypothetical protein